MAQLWQRRCIYISEQTSMGGTMATSVHVVPSGDEWAVEESGRKISTHRTQAEAERAGRDEAIRAKAELVVHGRDGQIEHKDSFGNDPRSVRG
jgi:uncharacterized protein DUF2188